MNVLKKYISPWFLVAFFATFTINTPSHAQPARATVRPVESCISFESPLTGAIFLTPSCTLSLNVACGGTVKTDLQVRYVPHGENEAIVQNLGSISRPPYKLLWDISQYPNQLFTGITVIASTVSGGVTHTAEQGGIFFAHNPVERAFIPMPYSRDVSRMPFTKTFDIGDAQVSARGAVVWSESGLHVEASVRDPKFYINRPGGDMAAMGLEILIDAQRERSLHPTEEMLRIIMPLSGAPHRINYRPVFGSGTFNIDTAVTPVNFAHNVTLAEFRGYSVQITIPREEFGRVMPDTIGMNLVLRILDDDGILRLIPLYGENIFEIYSPFTWSDYYKLPKPLLQNTGLRWLLFSSLGFITTLLIYIAYLKFRGPMLITNFEKLEEDKIAFTRVSAIMEQEYFKNNLSLDEVAAKCEMLPKALDALIKRNSGFNFTGYLQFCRTEAARKLLCSSRASEKSIADQCGFSSAIEMENCFIRFHKMTPYKYRQSR